LPYPQYAEVVSCCDIATFPYPDNPVYRSKCSARIIDYMAFRKAILTTAIGQNAEYIVDEESGLLAAPGDKFGYQAGLERLLQDPNLRTRLGNNARQRLLKNFRWREMAGDNCERAYNFAFQGRCSSKDHS
jgi:glycosyltransferase involved in cell wall biosynthesis